MQPQALLIGNIYASFPIIRHVLSYGFLACNYPPVVIAFPTLVGILLGPNTVVPNLTLLQVLPDFLSDLEARCLEKPLNVHK